MNRVIPIAGLVLLVVVGLTMGRRFGARAESPPNTAPEKAPVPESRPFGDTLDRLNRDLDDAELLQLELELDSHSFTELEHAYLRRIQEDPHAVDARRMLSVMLKKDALATIALVHANLEGSNLQHENARLFQEWGKFAPHEALRYATQLDAEAISVPLLSSGVQAFLGEWASHDPRAALDAWLALPQPKLADAGVAEEAAITMGFSAAHEPTMRELALEMLLDQPSSNERGKAIGGAVAVWAHAAPFEEVSAWLSAQDLEGTEASTVAMGIANGAIGQGLEGAEIADWLMEQIRANHDSAAERGDQLYWFAGRWAGHSMDDCAHWIAQLPPGRETDGALSGLISELEHLDPATGFQWATQISDDELRAMWCRKNWDKWRRVAPNATETYLTNLTEEERCRLGIEQ